MLQRRGSLLSMSKQKHEEIKKEGIEDQSPNKIVVDLPNQYAIQK